MKQFLEEQCALAGEKAYKQSHKNVSSVPHIPFLSPNFLFEKNSYLCQGGILAPLATILWQSSFVDVSKTLLTLPELVMETSQEHPGPSDPQSTTELRTKEFTELGRAGDLGGASGGMLAAPRQPFWTGTQLYSLKSQRESKATSGPWNLDGAPYDPVQVSLILFLRKGIRWCSLHVQGTRRKEWSFLAVVAMQLATGTAFAGTVNLPPWCS